MKHNLHSHPDIVHVKGDPWSSCVAWRKSGESAVLLVDFAFTPWWLDQPEAQQLTAIYCRRDDALELAVTEQALEADNHPGREQFEAWLELHQLFSVEIGSILPLQPVHIPKPWGQEIWFTGVEERGVCRFGGGERSVPIPWLQAALPPTYGETGPLVLLKVLDPDAAEVTGDLYFELHQEKREVYVVTHIDRSAWPDGTGYIRYGFDPVKLAQAGDDDLFRRQYLESVRAYESVRRQIDDDPGDVSAELAGREHLLREEMDSYTHMRPLRVGDVVVVPLLMPHSLQHGVRTIEFQTPVYERKILSFAQKVLTQGHWDTQEAIEQMRLLPPRDMPFDIVQQAEQVLEERVVDFPDFEVRRIRIEAGGSLPLALADSYGLVMVVEGSLALDGQVYGPEQAFLLPRERRLVLGSARAEEILVLLLALPRR